MAPETTSLQPVQKAARVQLLDVLRGFAILGIFIMNLWAFTYYFAYSDVQKSAVMLSQYDHVTTFLQHMLLEGKFYSIFSLLFGIGFSIYLAKASSNHSILPLFKRRLLVLLCIGFIHLLLWVGDIVAFYALLGFLLIPFRKWSDKSLLLLAGLCIVLPIPLYALKMWMPSVFNPGQYLIAYSAQLDSAAGIKNEQELVEVLRGGNFLQIVHTNLRGILWRFGDLLFQDRIFKVFGMFLVGLVIGRNNIYIKLDEHKKFLQGVCITGFIIGLPSNYIMSRLMEKGGYYQLTIDGFYQTVAYAVGVAPLALAYAAGFALLYRNSRVRNFMLKLAPVGRMALTNYIMHSVIGLFFFTRLGFALSGFGPTAWTLFAIGVYLFQVIVSTAWLSYFNYGPLEWVWRSATYGKWQPMLKERVV